MGFKLIRDKTPEHEAKLERLRKIQLDTEIRRWTNITNSSERKEKFIERFALVKSKRTEQNKADDGIQSLEENITEAIKTSQPDLVQIQGNIDMDRLMDLLN
jgi:hypothetical protein